MRKCYFLSLTKIVCFLLMSLFLQSCGGSGNLSPEEEEPIETTTIVQEGLQEQGLIGQGQELSFYRILPAEIWQYIFSYLDFEGVLAARAVSVGWNELITGFRQAGVLGAENKPCHMIDTRGWVVKKEINFKSEKLNQTTHYNIPSFPFYQLMGKVKHLPPTFWPYLPSTNIHTLVLRSNRIRDALVVYLSQHLPESKLQLCSNINQIGALGAIQLGQHLSETKVNVLDLSYNGIGDEGIIELVQHLQRTKVGTLYLGWNQISDAGINRLAQHLQETSVHTLDLSCNQISDTGVSELAKYLQRTNVHTVDLGNNQIRPDMQRLLVEQYPHIKWKF